MKIIPFKRKVILLLERKWGGVRLQGMKENAKTLERRSEEI